MRPFLKFHSKIVVAIISIFLVIQPISCQANTLSGPFEILDAETIRISGHKVTLIHIATPRPGETCPFKSRTIECGRIATTALLDLTAGAKVTCRFMQGSQKLARCWANGYDLSEGMIYTGWGRALSTAPEYLHKIERRAKSRQRGLWQGKFPPSVEKALAKSQN